MVNGLPSPATLEDQVGDRQQKLVGIPVRSTDSDELDVATAVDDPRGRLEQKSSLWRIPVSELTVVDADLNRPHHCDGLIAVLDDYARLPNIAGCPLPPEVKTVLPERLREQPGRVILLAVQDDRVVGVAVCFLGFSTFAARPLLNIHDLAVLGECRGQGVGGVLLKAVDDRARELGCCRVTLEVVEDNPGAKRLYERTGFRMVQEFWKKDLS